MPPTQIHFDHEKLVAYQCSIQFVAWKILLETVSLVIGLIKSISPDRSGEEPVA